MKGELASSFVLYKNLSDLFHEAFLRKPLLPFFYLRCSKHRGSLDLNLFNVSISASWDFLEAITPMRSAPEFGSDRYVPRYHAAYYHSIVPTTATRLAHLSAGPSHCLYQDSL